MLSVTVAVLVRVPTLPVTVMLPATGGGGVPVQPATTTNTSIAPARPSRVRYRRAAGIMNSMPNPSITNTTCRTEAGGIRKASGCTTSDFRVAVTVAFTIPGAELDGIVQEVTFADPVQLNDTVPLKPPSPVMVIGIMLATPLFKLALAGPVTEKSHAVPERA